jgi:hypothetical protein
MANRMSEGMTQQINLFVSNPPILTREAGTGKETGGDAVKILDGSRRSAPCAKMPATNSQ